MPPSAHRSCSSTLTAARPGASIGIVSNAATGTDPSVYWQRFVLAFAANQLGDAIACAIPLAIIRRDLDRLGCPESLQRALPVIKATSAAGLVLGTRWPSLGRLTAFSLAGYFLAAIGFHVRARDRVWRSVPAASLCTASAVIGSQAFRRRAF